MEAAEARRLGGPHRCKKRTVDGRWLAAADLADTPEVGTGETPVPVVAALLDGTWTMTSTGSCATAAVWWLAMGFPYACIEPVPGKRPTASVTVRAMHL